MDIGPQFVTLIREVQGVGERFSLVGRSTSGEADSESMKSQAIFSSPSVLHDCSLRCVEEWEE